MRIAPLRRTLAGICVVAASLSACTKENDEPAAHDDAAAESAGSAGSAEAVAAGARWLSGELSDGVLVNRQYRSDDYSTTVELAYALRAVDGGDEVLPAVESALADGVEHYALPGDDVYSGSLAKLLSFAVDQDLDPHAFGGQDLVSLLEERTADDGATAGRISDVSAYGDYANSFGQAWAVRGLTMAGSAEAAAARDFLLQQQCSAGFFRLYFAEPDADDQTCDGAKAAPEPVDTTALAYVLLHDLAEDDEELAAALDRGIDYILHEQAADGSFSGGSGDTIVPNANSTGLAGWALHLAGEDDAAAAAATWVRAHQVGSCPGRFADAEGAIAFDDASLAGTQGVTKKTEYAWRLATAQALPSLLALPDGVEAACPDAS